MSKENKQTLKVYDEKASTYISTGILHDKKDPAKAKRKKQKLEEFIKESLSTLPAGAPVLEIGAANGVNSKYMQSLGYDVTASDVAPDFLQACENLGLKTIKFDVLKNKFKQKYNGIFCWRVFVHFTLKDFCKALKKVYKALQPGGVFIFNAFNREERQVDCEWVDFNNEYHIGMERFYNYFKKQDIETAIAKVGFSVQNFFTQGGDNDKEWFVYVLKK